MVNKLHIFMGGRMELVSILRKEVLRMSASMWQELQVWGENRPGLAEELRLADSHAPMGQA
eukprot:3384524-Amphidinium_carterae.1